MNEHLDEKMDELRADYEHGREAMCTQCMKTLPQTPSYFHKDASTESGYKEVCIDCRKKKQEKEHNEELVSKVEALDKGALRFLDIATQRDANRVPHLAELFEQMMHVFGGADGLAKHYLSNYLAAPAGGQVRQRMLDRLIGMGQKVSELGAAQVPLDLIPEDELEKEVQERILSIANTVDEPQEDVA